MTLVKTYTDRGIYGEYLLEGNTPKEEFDTACQLHKSRQRPSLSTIRV
jgi:hypothetical protein